MELAQQISRTAPGTQEFLGSLQPATTHLWNELSAEEQEHYAETARDWLDNAPPNHIQSRQVMSQDGFGLYPRPTNLGLSKTAV
jgi:hypothetical protein